MPRRNFPKRVLVTALIAALGLSQGVSAVEGHASAKHAEGQHEDASLRLQKSMSGHHAPPITGNVDQDFASLMIVHHQQALGMVEILLEAGRDDELKAMARRMKETQQGEIKALAKFADRQALPAAKDTHDHADKGMADHHGDHADAMDKHFKALDANGDGNISRPEFDAGHKK